MTLAPNLFFHLKSVGAAPLKIAFKWFMRAFSGYLEADQLLILWDRMVAFDSTEILAVLAAGLFIYRFALSFNFRIILDFVYPYNIRKRMLLAKD